MAINYELLNKGGISLGTNFELLSEKPLDSRLVVPTLDGLQNYIDNAAAYEGLIAYVSSEKKHYEVKVIDGVLSYRPFGLTEAELNDIITNSTTAAMEFKGATATLPENPTKGDMYKVAGENIDIKIDDVDAKLGDSIVYDGTKWFLIPSGDDIEDTWRPVEGVNNDATLKFVDGNKTVAAVAADGTIKYNHATVAAPADTTAEGEEKTRTYITAVETDGYGHITGYKTATENVEDTNTTYEFEGQVEESGVYFQVTASEEGATAEVVYLDAYNKNEVDAKFAAAKTETANQDAVVLAEAQAYADGKDAAIEAAQKAADDTAAYVGTFTHDTAKTVVEYINAKTDGIATSGNLEALGQRVTAAEGEIDALQEASAKHVEKVEGKSLILDTEITRLAGMSDGANKVEKSTTNGNIKIDGEEVVVYTHPASHTVSEISDFDEKVKAYDYATKTEAQAMADGKDEAIAAAKKAGDDAQDTIDAYIESNNTALAGVKATADAAAVKSDVDAALADRYTKSEADGKFAIKGEDSYDDTALAGRVTTAEGKIAALETESAKHALKTELEAVDKKFEDYTKTADLPTDLGDFTNNAGYAKTADVNVELDKKADKTQVATDIANAIAPLATIEALNGVKATAEAAAVKTEVESALALKADKSVVDAMYTNTQIDTAVQGAKNYAKGLVDAIPEQTDYTVTITEATDGLDAGIAKKYTFTQNGAEIGTINLAKELVVTAGSVKEVETADAPYAGAKVGEKYIELVIANQETPIYVPAKDLVDIYTAKDGAAEIQVAISNTNEISATLVNGGITEEKLAADVKTKLNKTWEEVGVAKGLVDALADGQVKINKEAIENITKAGGLIATAKAEAISAAETKAGELDTALHTVISKEIDDDVKAAIDAEVTRADNKYETKGTAQGIVDDLKLSETYEPIGAEGRAIAAAKTETEKQVKALADTVYTKTETYTKSEVDALLTWGSF